MVLGIPCLLWTLNQRLFELISLVGSILLVPKSLYIVLHEKSFDGETYWQYENEGERIHPPDSESEVTVRDSQWWYSHGWPIVNFMHNNPSPSADVTVFIIHGITSPESSNLKVWQLCVYCACVVKLWASHWWSLLGVQVHLDNNWLSHTNLRFKIVPIKHTHSACVW